MENSMFWLMARLLNELRYSDLQILINNRSTYLAALALQGKKLVEVEYGNESHRFSFKNEYWGSDRDALALHLWLTVRELESAGLYLDQNHCLTASESKKHPLLSGWNIYSRLFRETFVNHAVNMGLLSKDDRGAYQGYWLEQTPFAHYLVLPKLEFQRHVKLMAQIMEMLEESLDLIEMGLTGVSFDRGWLKNRQSNLVSLTRGNMALTMWPERLDQLVIVFWLVKTCLMTEELSGSCEDYLKLLEYFEMIENRGGEWSVR